MPRHKHTPPAWKGLPFSHYDFQKKYPLQLPRLEITLKPAHLNWPLLWLVSSPTRVQGTRTKHTSPVAISTTHPHSNQLQAPATTPYQRLHFAATLTEMDAITGEMTVRLQPATRAGVGSMEMCTLTPTSWNSAQTRQPIHIQNEREGSTSDISLGTGSSTIHGRQVRGCLRHVSKSKRMECYKYLTLLSHTLAVLCACQCRVLWESALSSSSEVCCY